MVQRARCSGKTSRGTRKHISLYADTSDEDDRESDDGAIITMCVLLVLVSPCGIEDSWF